MKVAGYVRLSRDDGNDESVSITNQKRILNDYANRHNMTIDEFYVDDGYSGYKFDRPSFNKLKQDLEDNLVDIVLVKDLSRIGRHNAKTLLFIEDLTKLNKQLIIVSEDYNNLEDNDDMIGIKTWFNERYVKDTSKKIKLTISNLQKTGDWFSIPYGYKRNFLKTREFTVDPEASEYVKKIYEWYIDGYGILKITRKLQEENIPTPTQMYNIHRMEVGLEPTKFCDEWNHKSVTRILSNEFYIGTLVVNKTKRTSIRGKKIENDKSEYIYFENHHEPIIDKETFDLVQQIKKERATVNYRGGYKISLFSGMIKCGDCGEKMYIHTRKNRRDTYICSSYHRHGAKRCNSNRIAEEDLVKYVVEYLKICRNNLKNEIEELDDKIKKEIDKNKNAKTDTVESLEKKLKQANLEVKSLISQKTKEMIKSPSMADMIEDTYQEMIDDKMKYILNLREEINSKKTITHNPKEIKENLNRALATFDEIIESGTLTRRQAQILIDKIIVYHNKGIVIKMRGNLNAIVNPSQKLDIGEKAMRYRTVIEAIYKRKEFFIREIRRDIKEQGIEFNDRSVLPRILKRFEKDGFILKSESKKERMKLLKDKDEMLSFYKLYQRMDTDQNRCADIVTVSDLEKIGRWANGLSQNVHKFSV